VRRLLLSTPAGVLALGIAACGGTSTTTTQPAKGSAVMPAVVGLSQRQALRKFDGIRITVYVYPERNRTIPRGLVFRQTPAPGTSPSGGKAAIYVSNGPRGPLVGHPFIGHR
jgi:beta-lactam-binding protein with PASTA domain